MWVLPQDFANQDYELLYNYSTVSQREFHDITHVSQCEFHDITHVSQCEFCNKIFLIDIMSFLAT